MNDKDFKKMDETWMKKMEPVRDKEVSEGMLRGFPASVERRIAAREGSGTKRSPVFRPAWAGALTVMALAAFTVLFTPVVSMDSSHVPSSDDLETEIEMLKELGAMDEFEDETFLGEEAVLAADGLA